MIVGNIEFKSNRISFFSLLWAIYTLLLILSVKKSLRFEVASFSIHPALIILGFIILSVILYASLIDFKGASAIIIGGYAYILIMILSSYFNYLIYDYPFNPRFIVKWGVFFLTIVLVMVTVKRKTEFIVITKAIVLLITLISLYGIVKAYIHPSGDSHINPFRDFATQNAFSNWNAGVFILGLYIVSAVKSIKEKIFWLASLIIMISAQFFTMSRFGWLLIISNFVYFFIIAGKKKYYIYLVVFIMGFIVFLYILEKNNSLYTDRLFKRFKTVSTKEKIQRTFRQRTIHADKTFSIFFNHPLIGIGTENYSQYFYKWEYNFDDIKPPHYREASHSQYFNIISETGLLGMVILFAMLIKPVLLIFRYFKHTNADKKFLMVLWASVSLYLFRGLTSHEVLFIPTTAVIFGLAFGYTNMLKDDSQSENALK